MSILKRTLIVALAASTAMSLAASAQSVNERAAFRDPPAIYRPIATLGGGGPMADDLAAEAKRVLVDDQAGSIMFSPEADPSRAKPMDLSAFAGGRPIGLQDSYPAGSSHWLPKALPGEAGNGSFGGPTIPKKRDTADGAPPPPPKPRPGRGYMTPAYFAAVARMLEVARANGKFATFYDEVGFPSGSADKTLPAKYFRKVLRRDSATLSNFQNFRKTIPAGATLQAVIAINSHTGERIDLTAKVSGGEIAWRAPLGDWQVQTFYVTTGNATPSPFDYSGSTDYLDPEAVRWFIDATYGRLASELPQYVGKTINMSFFDDVGIYWDEKTWGAAVNDRFRKLTGRDPALYYPALWQDIGPDTAAARIAFFRARAELLGEGFPKMVTEWDHRHGLLSSGHTPGNYDIQPTDMNGDPFKFYAYTDIPMVDVIFGHGFGREGYKLISSVSSQRDLPITAAETFSSSNTIMGYRRLIELYVRGINRFVTAAGPRGEVKGTPAEFNAWAGRCSMLLQGGQHVADVAIVYPIDSLQAFYSFDAPANDGALPAGMYVSKDTDYQAVGGMLVDDLHRDFTFIHPEALASDKFAVSGKTLVMNNRINREQYRTVIVPGGDVISLTTLKKLKAFYDAGGSLIATSLLPSKSAEFGADAKVRAMITEMFGIDPGKGMPDGVSRISRNENGGQAVFVRRPDPKVLTGVFDDLKQTADVRFEGDPAPRTGNGVFGYIHRRKNGQEIYFFGNSSDTPIGTYVRVRGKIRPELWNPHTGATTPAPEVSYIPTPDGVVTRFRLDVPALSSMFAVAR